MANRLHTPLCEMFGIEYPIVLAGMSAGGGVGGAGMATPPKLAAAVTNAGGLGVMGCGDRKLETIEWCIREVQKLTSGPFGVDLLLPATMAEVQAENKAQVWQRLEREYPAHVAFVRGLVKEYDLPEVGLEEDPPMSMAQLRKQVEVVLDYKVPVFVAGLGDPFWVVPMMRPLGTKIGGMVGSVRNAMRQQAAGVDFMTAQGTEGGGHTGSIATFVLVPQVVDAVAPTPVMAAGGVGSGRQVAAALALGAQAVWVGTAFLVADECTLRPEHQDQILHGASEDFTLTKFSTGKQNRSYKNSVKQTWEKSGLQALPMPLQGILMEPFTRAARQVGRWDLVANPSGQIGGMLSERRPAREILMELVNGAEEAIEGLQRNLR